MKSVRDFIAHSSFPPFSPGVKWEKAALWVGGTVWLWPRFQCLLAPGHWHPLFYTCVCAPFTRQFQIHTGLSVSSLSYHQDSAASSQALHPSLAQKHWFPHPEAPDTTRAHLPGSLCALASSALVSWCRWSPPWGLLPFCLVPSASIYLLSKIKTLAFWKSIVTVKKKNKQKKDIRNSNDFPLSFFG